MVNSSLRSIILGSNYGRISLIFGYGKGTVSSNKFSHSYGVSLQSYTTNYWPGMHTTQIFLVFLKACRGHRPERQQSVLATDVWCRQYRTSTWATFQLEIVKELTCLFILTQSVPHSQISSKTFLAF